MNNKGYTIYVANKCEYCKKMKRLLLMQGLQYKTVLIRHNAEAIKFLQERNLYTVPQLFEDGKLIGGYEDALQYFNKERKESTKL